MTFEQELSSHRPYLAAIARRMCRCPAAAEDLVQETSLKAFSGKQRFEPGSNMRAWLRRILVNSYVSGREKEDVRSRAVERMDLEDCIGEWMGRSSFRSSREDAVHDLLVAGRLLSAVSSIPAAYGEAVRLVDIEGEPYADAAKSMGCPVGTVMSRLHRGRKMLAAAVGASP